MRRQGPRPLAAALADLQQTVAPATTLARVQRAWSAVAGPGLSAEAEPIAERAGVLTLACRSSVWAQELDLLAGELVERLNGALEAPPDRPALRRIRVVVR